jgi:hypothetical protein
MRYDRQMVSLTTQITLWKALLMSACPLLILLLFKAVGWETPILLAQPGFTQFNVVPMTVEHSFLWNQETNRGCAIEPLVSGADLIYKPDRPERVADDIYAAIIGHNAVYYNPWTGNCHFRSQSPRIILACCVFLFFIPFLVLILRY